MNQGHTFEASIRSSTLLLLVLGVFFGGGTLTHTAAHAANKPVDRGKTVKIVVTLDQDIHFKGGSFNE